MKIFIISLSALLMLLSAPLVAKEELSQLAEQTDQLYRAGCGAEDGVYTALSSSMVAWGVGAVVVIAVLVGSLHSSTAHSGHNH